MPELFRYDSNGLQTNRIHLISVITAFPSFNTLGSHITAFSCAAAVTRFRPDRGVRLRGGNSGNKRYGGRGIRSISPFSRGPRKAYRHAHPRHQIHGIRGLVGGLGEKLRDLRFGYLAVPAKGLESFDEFFEPGGPLRLDRLKSFGVFRGCLVDVAGVFRMLGNTAFRRELADNVVAPFPGGEG
ncbi:MAG: hypothetical protein BWY49_00104 [Candidatus Omnitrophica bacterium ADurb.Bin314]|nr:MAG: hypothetical protein BWY49_00104 [Candidatus Omnitrophica bacterium ADurb.Bin314]